MQKNDSKEVYSNQIQFPSLQPNRLKIKQQEQPNKRQELKGSNQPVSKCNRISTRAQKLRKLLNTKKKITQELSSPRKEKA